MSLDRHASYSFEASTTSRNNSDTAAMILPREVSQRFGRRLRELRLERNYTQLRVAWDCGIDPGLVRNVEEGRGSISVATLELIAAGMCLSISELLKTL